MKFTERPFIYKASPEIIKRAAVLRKNLTPAERALLGKLGMSQLYGLCFKSQHPIGKFIVDFYCPKLSLVIEIDGDIHAEVDIAERDEERENELKNYGLKILRFSNEEVLNNIDIVLDSIRLVLTTPPK
ncbi:MAG TPA: endonuclease domain-containing protein [Bacteroidia bacterium]|jgi:very-short-patch-repair endonuclease|nr:endonuclease domain-containing protein [Bacteroidia bacterium]